MYVLQASSDKGFEGFSGVSMALLVAGCAAAVAWLALFAVLWLASRPRFPEPGPPTAECGPETPAVANMLVNRWRVTRIAMAATLVDLAARRVLGLEDYAGGRHVVRIRSNQPEGERFTAYEQQVLDLVRSRATGNSAPVEALDLGNAVESASWWRRFEKAVQRDAKDRGLARGRWTARDRNLLGGGLAVVLVLLAASFAIARVGGGPDEDDLDPWSWFVIAGLAWAGATGWFAKSGALRETAAGRVACARWLGLREYLRGTAAFGDVPPGSVSVWERYLSYAVGFGLARATATALPFATDDPGTAWSRYGGEWRQIRISYPKRWGFGQPPWQVFLTGLALTVFWGVIGLMIVPALARGAWDVGLQIIEDGDLGGRAEFWLATGIWVVVSAMGLYIVFRLIGGLGRLILGGMDLTKRITITGEVANVYMGRVALADGRSDQVRAWTPPVGTGGLHRGQVLRVTMSPRLCHVTSVEQLKAAELAVMPVPAGAAIAQAAATSAAGLVPGGPLTAESLSAMVGLPLQVATAEGRATDIDDSSGAFMRTFSDGAGGMLRVFMTPAIGPAAGLIGLIARLPRQAELSVAGEGAQWAGEHLLTVPIDGRMLGVEVELPEMDEERRKAVAVQVAEAIVAEQRGSAAPAGSGALAASDG